MANHIPTILSDYPLAILTHEVASKFGVWDPARKVFTDCSGAAADCSAMELLLSLEENIGWDPKINRENEAPPSFRKRVDWLWSELHYDAPFRLECPVLQILSTIANDKEIGRRLRNPFS